LILSGQPLAFIEDQTQLRVFPLAFLGLGYRCDVIGAAAIFDDALRRLALSIKFPVPFGIGVRRVENRSLEEWIIHV